jgi:hypothetical protein
MTTLYRVFMKSKLQSLQLVHFHFFTPFNTRNINRLSLPSSISTGYGCGRHERAKKRDTGPLHSARRSATRPEWLPREPGQTSKLTRRRRRYFPLEDVVLSPLPVWSSAFRLYRLYRLFVLTENRLQLATGPS